MGFFTDQKWATKFENIEKRPKMSLFLLENMHKIDLKPIKKRQKIAKIGLFKNLAQN